MIADNDAHMARLSGLPMHILRLARQTVLGLAVVAGALAAFVFFGFLVFAHQVSVMEPDPSASADAVVALTGGSERIDEAVRLLADGRARRLLISGVHPRTTATAIGRLAGAGKPLLDCCIDLDRHALDTAGNADETARWLEARGYSSLIVVTSAYHMPRSLAEFRRVLPDARLIPHPVVADSLRLDRWWQRPMTAKLLFAEYVKYIVARARGLVAVPRQGKMVAASAGH